MSRVGWATLAATVVLVAPFGFAEGQDGPSIRERWREVEALPPASPERIPRAAALAMEAGDFGGCLRLCERALAAHPENLELLWRAASVSVALRDAERARRFADGLWAAVQESASGQEDWQRAALELERAADELAAKAEERARLLRRARLFSGGAFAALVALLLGLLRSDAIPPRSGEVE